MLNTIGVMEPGIHHCPSDASPSSMSCPSYNPTQDHSPHLPLHTLPRLQHAPISTNKKTLPRPRQAVHIPGPPSPHDQRQALHIQPDPLLRLADHIHPAQHRLAVPVLQAQPQSPRGDIRLRHGLDVARVVGREVQEEGWRWGLRAAADDGRDEAGCLEGEHERQDEVGGGHGGEA